MTYKIIYLKDIEQVRRNNMKYIITYINENKETIKEKIESKKLNKRVEELKNNNLEILSLSRDYSKDR